VFVLGMNRHVVEQGIRVRYKEFELAGGLVGPVDPRQYLDKIIQVPFRLPPLSDRQMEEFLKRWCDRFGQSIVKDFAKIIATGVASNPRSVKRALNMLGLALELEAWHDRKELDELPGERLKAMFAMPPYYEPLNDDQLRELVFVTEMAS
jgi:hypothetical protein